MIFWHSAVNGIFAGRCEGAFPPSADLAAAYGRASGYPRPDGFSAYPVTGDATDWLAGQGIAAITVELARHDTLEWEANLAGMQALIAGSSSP